MVRYYNDEGVFEASIEKIWHLIQAHTDANVHHIHASFLKQSTHEEKPGVLVADVTMRGPDGKTMPVRIRFAPRPPHANNVEFVTGPFAGSTFTNLYFPEGNRTRVISVGDFRVAGVTDEATTLKIVDDFMEAGFAEDSAYLRKMA